MQQINLDKNIKLLDCPGIVFRKQSSSPSMGKVPQPLLKNYTKKSDSTDIILEAIGIIQRCNKQQLSKLFNLHDFLDPNDFLILLARQRGRIKKGGIPDIESAAEILTNEWNLGRIPFYTLPPEQGENQTTTGHISTEIVSTWSKEFNIDEIIASENHSLVEVLEPNSVRKAAKQILAEPSQISESLHIYNRLNDGDDNDGMECSEDDNMESIDTPATVVTQPENPEVKIAQTGPISVKKVRFNLHSNEGPFTPEEKKLNPIKQKKSRSSSNSSSTKKTRSAEASCDMSLSDDDRYDFEEHFPTMSRPSDKY